jgi:hypothetical protein
MNGQKDKGREVEGTEANVFVQDIDIEFRVGESALEDQGEAV